VDIEPIGRQQVPNLTHTSTAERGNPVRPSSTRRRGRVGEPRGKPNGVRAWDVGRSEGHAV